MTEPTPTALLSFIRGAETSRGYEDYYRGSKLAPPKPVTTMTVREVQEWQDASVRAGSASSAVGGYQIIRKTFKGLVSEMKLTGDELFDNTMQDRMGTHLVRRRGYDAWTAGRLSDEAFSNNLAGEWASLPMPNGRSRYAGDGLNAAGRTRNQVLAALTSTRNGEDVDLSGISPENQTYVASARAMSEADRQARTDIDSPTGSYTGADLGVIQDTPLRAFTTDREVAAQEAADVPQVSLWEGAQMAIDEQWVGNTLLRQIGKESFAPDDNFQFNDELWKEVTAGLPEDYQRVMSGAMSADHARALAAETRQSYERDSKLASLGWTGMGLQFGAAMIDPVAIAATAVTEGVLGPVVYGAKLSKLSRVVRAGLLGAATNVAIDGYLTSQDPVGQWSDLSYSAAAGFILGGAVGAFRPSPVDGDMARQAANFIAIRDAADAALEAVPAGSAGAMRVGPLRPLTNAEQALQMATDAAPARATGVLDGARIDIMGGLMKSENALVRRVATLLDENAVGNADGSVSIYSAYEKKSRIQRNFLTRFYTDHDAGFRGWVKENGRGGQALYDPAVRAEFNTLVGKAVARPIEATDNAHVAKVAARVKSEMAEALRFGKEHNIRGFQTLKESDTYVTRQHNVQRIDEMANLHKGNLTRFFADAFMSGEMKYRNANPGKLAGKAAMTYDDALLVSQAYIKSIRSRKYQGMDVQMALTGENTDLLREMLDDVGVNPADVARITDNVRLKADSDGGRIRSAKHRIILDEEYVDPRLGMAVEDFLDRDIENLFTGYVNSITGEAAIEEAFSKLKLTAADGTEMGQAPSYSTVRRWIEEGGKTSDRELQLLDTLYKAVKGIPQEPEAAWSNFLQRVRGFNFVRVMGQVGVAQIAEFGAILGNGGMVNFTKHAPSFGAIIRAAKGGKLNDAFMDEVEAIWSNANDVLLHSPHIRVDGENHIPSLAMRGGKSTGLQKFDYTLNKGKRATATLSGMTHINMMLKRMNSRVLVQRFLDHASGDRAINMRRFKSLGIDESMADRISAQMKKHVSTREGVMGKKATHINIATWDDVDAKNAFINGVDRWSRRVVLENNPGAMPAFMTKEMGKMIFQFRSFMLGSYTKVLLAGIRQNDWETYSTFMASMVFGGAAYVAQTQINSVGRADRDEWIEDRLSMSSIAKASFQRAGFSTFMPMLIDLGATPFVDEPIFAYRTTDLSTGIWGNPSVDLLNTSGRALKGVLKAALSEDYEFSQQDARALASTMPLQNAFVIRNVLAAVTGHLPQFSQ